VSGLWSNQFESEGPACEMRAGFFFFDGNNNGTKREGVWKMEMVTRSMAVEAFLAAIDRDVKRIADAAAEVERLRNKLDSAIKEVKYREAQVAMCANQSGIRSERKINALQKAQAKLAEAQKGITEALKYCDNSKAELRQVIEAARLADSWLHDTYKLFVRAGLANGDIGTAMREAAGLS
jgi:cell fate (sporulation/competence/biofilm development) regulator YmcA (YheA/YmcA/DUF963 family)